MELWDNKESIVHRLPEQYQQGYWKNLLRDRAPVHYREGSYPIIGVHPPEADRGLWGGETVVKGYIESRPYTKKKVLPRHWVPRLFFPYLKDVVLYSEVLDKSKLL